MKTILQRIRIYDFFLLISILLLILWIVPKLPETYNEPGVQIDSTYLHSYAWETKNPFKEIEIDTIKIIDIKKGYVQYIILNNIDTTYKHSTKLRYIVDDIRDINFKQ